MLYAPVAVHGLLTGSSVHFTSYITARGVGSSDSPLPRVACKCSLVGASGGCVVCVVTCRNANPLPAKSVLAMSAKGITLFGIDLPIPLSIVSFFNMSTLAEIEAAADLLPDNEKEVLLRFLAMRLRKARATPQPRVYGEEELAIMLAEDEADGERQKGLTPEEFEAWFATAWGAGLPGVTTDEIMAMMRGEE